MIVGASLPRYLWPEAIHAMVYIINHSPTFVNLDSMPPLESLQEAMHHRPTSNVTHLCAYGVVTYVQIPLETRPCGDKFNVRSQKGYLVGYADGITYRVWVPSSNTVIQSIFVRFDKMSFSTLDASTHGTPLIEVPKDNYPNEEVVHLALLIPYGIGTSSMPSIVPTITSISMTINTGEATSKGSNTKLDILPIVPPPFGQHTEEEIQENISVVQLPMRRSLCNNKGIPSTCFDGSLQLTIHLLPTLMYAYGMNLHTSNVECILKTHKDAMTGPNASKWHATKDLELHQLKRHNVA